MTPVSKEGRIAGMYLLVTVLWFHQRHGRWPITREMSRMKSWSYEHRPEGIAWLREMGFLVREKLDGATINRVTDDGAALVKPPSLVKVYPETPVPLPDDEHESWLVGWIYTFYERNGRWPTPWHYQSCGLYQNDIAVFRETLENLVNTGLLVRIHLRRGLNNVTRLVDTTYCPWLKGCDRQIFYWSNVEGPLTP